MPFNLLAGAVAGFVATVVLTILMMPVMKKGPGFSAVIASKLTKSKPTDKKSMMLGMVLHFIYGTVIGGVVFIYLFNFLSLAASAVLVYSVAWGVILFILSQVYMAAFGMMSQVVKMKGMIAAFFVLHVIFGVVMGYLLPLVPF